MSNYRDSALISIFERISKVILGKDIPLYHWSDYTKMYISVCVNIEDDYLIYYNDRVHEIDISKMRKLLDSTIYKIFGHTEVYESQAEDIINNINAMNDKEFELYIKLL